MYNQDLSIKKRYKVFLYYKMFKSLNKKGGVMQVTSQHQKIKKLYKHQQQIKNNYIKYQYNRRLQYQIRQKHQQKYEEQRKTKEMLKSKADIEKVKIFGFVNFFSYPGGGGEEFLYDLCLYCVDKGVKIVWFYINEWNNTLPVDTPNITFIKIDSIENSLENQLKELPNLASILHSGKGHNSVTKIGKKLNIPVITIWCYWEEILQINPTYGTSDILKNIDSHAPNPNFTSIINNATNYFFASHFMKDVIEKKYNIQISDTNILPTLPMNNRSKKDDSINSFDCKYITIINCHNKKGGMLFAELIKKNPEKYFIAINSENDPPTASAIKSAMNLASHKENILMGRTNNIKDIYNKTKIIVCPTQLDETFCRVVYEAFQNKIAVIFSNKGNLNYLTGKNLLKMNTYNADTYNKSIKLLENREFYNTVIDAQSEYIKNMNILAHFENIYNIIIPKRVGIFTPWCDQGLGIQSRIYREILEKNGIPTAILSSHPLNSKDSKNSRIADTSEWDIEQIYKSPNNRFNVMLSEIDYFIETFNISCLIIPELNNNVFEIASHVKSRFSIPIYGIPNIECIFNREIPRCKVFDKILINNRSTEEYFKNFQLDNVEYLGFAYTGTQLVNYPQNMINLIGDDKIVKFLHLTGLNGFTRKRTIEILDTFQKLEKQGNTNFILTVVVQGNFTDYKQCPVSLKPYTNISNINIIQKHLTYSDILQLYQEHHVSLQISKHEGLGLGFYESCYMNTPVLSLDTAPHNEIIHNNKNGWLIKSWLKFDRVRDCTDTTAQAHFNMNDLYNKILYIISNISDTNKIISETKQYLDNLHDIKSFSEKICSLNPK